MKTSIISHQHSDKLPSNPRHHLVVLAVKRGPLKTSKNRLRAMVAAATLWSCAAFAADIGHFNGGVMNIRDYLVPEPGFYGVLYNYYYTTDRLNDRNGHKVNSVSINPGPGPGVT